MRQQGSLIQEDRYHTIVRRNSLDRVRVCERGPGRAPSVLTFFTLPAGTETRRAFRFCGVSDLIGSAPEGLGIRGGGEAGGFAQARR